jgi:hypothetical protein
MTSDEMGNAEIGRNRAERGLEICGDFSWESQRVTPFGDISLALKTILQGILKWKDVRMWSLHI